MSGSDSLYQVLCVDDEEFLLDLCKLFLERSGDLKVDTALSASLGLERLREKEYDAIISDYEMPGMNGVEFLKEVRAFDENIPFIIFTGRGREEVVIEALNNGADFYLQKGGDPKAQFAELKSKVDHAIKQKHAEKILEQERQQLLSIFDSLDQVVYVSDPKTYEILYVNKSFQNFLGHDVIGRICYEEFQNRKTPCEFCTNSIIFTQKPLPYSWEHYNSVFNRYYSIVDRVIRWPDGRDVRLEVATDVTEAKRALEELNAAYEEIASSEDELKHQFLELNESREHLKESEERYRSVIENTQDVFYRSDAQGNLIMASPSALRLFGYDSLDEIIGKNIADTFYQNPDERQKLMEILQKKGSVYNYETPLLKRDKTPIWVSTNTHVYYDKNGAFAGVEGNIRDITDIKKTSMALRENEELYRFLVEHIEDGVFIVQDDLIVFCNATFANIIGYSRDEILGSPMYEYISPEYRDELIWKCHNSKEYDVIIESSEIRFLHKDKKTKVSVIISLRIGEYKGRHACIGTIHHAARLYEQVEHSLRESRAMLNAILQESPIPQFVIDKNHKVVYWNQALSVYSGIPSNEVIGTDEHWRAFYPEPRPCIADLILDGRIDDLVLWYKGNAKQSTLVKDAWSSIGFFSHLGEHGIWLYFTGALLRDSNGDVWGALETLEDVTEQKMNEEGLREANKKLNLLSETTRHDILNTLTVLTGAIDLIRDEISDQAASSYLQPVDTALDTIYRQILFTRDYQNLGITSPVWQSLPAIIEETIIQVLPKEIRFTQDNINYDIYADAMLGRVFANLVDNTLRHGGTVSEVRVTAREEQDMLYISYADDGKGIEDSIKEQIFNRGFGSHTGYGLFLVREILSITHCIIQEVGTVGKGVVFEIHVPSTYFKIHQS
ncbi:PAS domain S-box protein [Methanospirillum hungatei]|uniref:PAS domain S-box protein n=1 Tax=Methanospirillum hungatei TaxID=2203 RepID=UPI001B410416|nr:PAS domain S-box protein [Methanospirillum hungatei]MBP9007521.1 PAS domain S-box protein [Methanospirillum sp.]HOW05556.1 PAS domain S-box protein [Methanospirillum hungatei]